MPLWKKAWASIGLLAARLKSGGLRRSGETARGALFPQRILYFEFTRAGDLICATPFLALLRRTWPAVRITLVVYKEVAEVARGLPEVDRVVALDRSKLWNSAKRLWTMRHAPDTLVLSHSINPLVTFYFWVTDAAAFAGYLWSHTFVAPAGQGLNMERVARPFDHLVEQRLDIARALGLPAERTGAVRFSIDRESIRPEISDVLADLAESRKVGMRIVTLSPGSRTPEKQWPLTHFTATEERLLKRKDLRIVVVGGAGDQGLGDGLKTAAPTRVVNLAGETNFMEFAAVVGESDVVICNDSAALHLAAALRVPCVALFGPVEPGKVVHRFAGYQTVGLTGTAPCLCGYNVFDERPCTHDHQCLVSLAPERVAEAAEGLLDSR